MQRRSLIVLGVLGLILAAVLAWAALAPTAQPPTPTVAPTSTAAPTAVQQPTASFCDTVDPSQIQINTMGLPYSWQANCVAATPYDNTQPPNPMGLPEHIQINFGVVNPADKQPGDPVIYIIPKQDYIQHWEAAGDTTVTQLMSQIEDMVLQQGATMTSSGMPVLPMEEVGGVNDLAVQGEYVSFGNWSGIRFVGRFVQDANPVTNQGLRYIFQGFAGDQNQYFIAFFYPVRTPYLPDDVSGISAEEMARFNADTQAYMEERITYLNGLTEADWDPNLSVLDSVMASLEYTGAQSVQPVPTVAPPTPAPQAPYALVTSPSGVNIRTGPGTNYPIIGLAPYGSTLAITGRSADGQWWVTPIQGAPNNQGWISAAYVQAFNAADVPVVPAPPPPVPTATPLPPATPVPQISFWADQEVISQGECTTLRWQVDNVQAVWVYPAGEPYQQYPATGEGSRQVCPSVTTTYEMRVQHFDGSVETRQVTISVTPGNPLANTAWLLESMNVNQVPVSGTSLTIFFSAANTVEGSGGCNTFTGPYSVIGTSIAIGPLGATRVSCSDEVNTQEQLYFQALQSATAYELTGSQLILRNAAGQEVLRFNRTG